MNLFRTSMITKDGVRDGLIYYQSPSTAIVNKSTQSVDNCSN